MKHLGIIVFIIGVLIGTLYLFKDELFFQEHTSIGSNSVSKSPITDETATEESKKQTKENIAKPESKNLVKEKPKKEDIKPKEDNKVLEKPKQIKPVIEEIKAKIKGLKKEKEYVKVTLIKDQKEITAYMNFDEDLYILLEDAMKYNLPLIFVIKKENDKVYIEEIK